jgi:CRP/FNR family transcriptional regulator, cyclic AMP receptor protein
MNPEELKSVAVLQAMDVDALARLAAALEETTYEDGQTVFAEGDPGDSMYFILKGHIRIEKRAAATGSAHKILTVLEDGDYFGEMALMDQKPRSASAVTAGNARILRLSKAAFDALQQSGRVAAISILFGMIRTSSDRIRRLSSQLVVYDEVGKAIGEAGSLQALLEVILRQLSTATSADWGLLLLRSQFSEQFELRCHTNVALTPAQSAALCKGEGFLGPILQKPQDWLVVDFENQEPFRACTRLGFESTSLLVSPIGLEGQLLGLIVLGGLARQQFDLNALNLVRGIARQTAQAILNARHREEEQARSRHSRQFVRF